MIRARVVTSLEDRLAATAVGHASSPPEKAPPLELYQAIRLRLARRVGSDWWLLEEDGRPVATLVCHPLQLAHGGRGLPGYGLGAVATRKDAQHRGHAQAICRAAIEASEAAGRTVGLLFSAIPPALYERMGFVVAPCFQPVCERADGLAGSGPATPLRPVDPRGEAEALARAWEAAHDGLHLFRDPAAWRRTVEWNPTDAVFALGDTTRGYVRLCFEEKETVEVVEVAAPAEEVPAALRAVASLAVRAGRGRLSGWFEPPPEVASWFAEGSRATTLPMVRGHADLARARFWSSDYF